jgi:outer membrane protein assembly factor BamE (lipoprotein component of BamABCDE complex)
MKTKLISLLLSLAGIVILTSCVKNKVTELNGVPHTVSEFKHDSCYYLYDASRGFMLHKANCLNPIHKTQ